MGITTYIAFLRGVNVGGHTVKMERLRELFLELGVGNVRSYIQSGNVFFETAQTNRSVLSHSIGVHLAAALGYEVPVILRTPAEVERALQLNPFEHMEVTAEMRLFLIFLSDPLPTNMTLPIHSPTGEFEIVLTTPGEAFVVMRLVNGKPGNPVAYIERTFKVRATSRFFATTAKILQACRSG